MGTGAASELTLDRYCAVNLQQVIVALQHARDISGHADYVVIGSLSILGVEDGHSIPEEMSMSIDIDCYTKADPPRIFDLVAPLGEDSPFRIEHGYYLDPVSPHLPSLPEGWEARMLRIDRGDLHIWFIDPNDAAISKYARSEPRDLRWIRAGLTSGLISLPTVKYRLRSTTFLDTEEEQRVRKQVQEDSHWFETVIAGRSTRI